MSASKPCLEGPSRCVVANQSAELDDNSSHRHSAPTWICLWRTAFGCRGGSTIRGAPTSAAEGARGRHWRLHWALAGTTPCLSGPFRRSSRERPTSTRPTRRDRKTVISDGKGRATPMLQTGWTNTLTSPGFSSRQVGLSMMENTKLCATMRGAAK